MCLTYESIREPLFFAETRVVTVKKVEIAPEYERVHFVGHALWNPTLTREQLMPQASALEEEIEQDTGYAAFVRDIKIQQYPPGMTDIDYIIDIPTTKLGPIDPLTIIAIIAIIAAIFAWIIYLFWTSWIEKVKLYMCDQCTDHPTFEGWLNYLAHLKEKHPAKYEAIEENKSSNWWEGIPSTIKWVVGGVVVVSAIGLVVALVKGAK